MGDTPEHVLRELAIDAETRVLATPGNFSDAATWLIQLDPEQVLPDPLDTPEAHENAMKHRRRTQAPPVRQLLAAWDTVTRKARYCHVAHGSDAWQVTRDDACKIVLLAAFLREDFVGDSLGFNYPWDGPDECEFSFEGRCCVITLLTSGGIPALSVGLVIELVQEAVSLLTIDTTDNELGERTASVAGVAPQPLTDPQVSVLLAMAELDGSRLSAVRTIVGGMEPANRISEETARKCVLKLIDFGLAERPEGTSSGSRLTIKGRQRAGKIAD